MNRISFSELAESDIDDIWIGIALENQEAADRVIDGLDKVLVKLLAFPSMGRAADHLRAGARAFVYRDYVIVYRPTVYGIAVLRLVHGARSLELIDIPSVPVDRCEKPFVYAYEVLADLKLRMGDARLRISRSTRMHPLSPGEQRLHP
jgi:toxin ParE1/3/4